MELELNKINVPTLCLNMIVKNESKIIERLLTSVLSIIDTFCICDTGSTDNTIDIINTDDNIHSFDKFDHSNTIDNNKLR